MKRVGYIETPPDGRPREWHEPAAVAYLLTDDADYADGIELITRERGFDAAAEELEQRLSHAAISAALSVVQTHVETDVH